MVIAILCLQGAFIEHQRMLQKLGIETVEIRKKDDLTDKIDGLVLPGGESTSMAKLLHDLELFKPIQKMIMDGLPTFGTCAGMILMAKTIKNTSQFHFQTMDIEVMRNGYGRQSASFQTESFFANEMIPQIFIRAPYIEKVGTAVEILSTVNNKIVAAKQNNQLVTAFHPELSENTFVHQFFINMIKNKDL
ncbi:MAG: pyridoxal 5'-phosphate synthase glutaminase subunit PdxT [Bacilli bacterium]|jgi:5'-phosphate synthase pdxT subunit|nr:pyridoxal 5'-phosphate synthase glutaminase subunit PdxT [Bacilli bacterium]MDY0064160.1 pyridoxal 5'-phosphate synthase glutaminase subunit PdxT [Bacilli bacterium]